MFVPSAAFKEIDDLLQDRQPTFDAWQRHLVKATGGGKRSIPEPSSQVNVLLGEMRAGNAAGYLAKMLELSGEQQRTVRAYWPRLPRLTVGEWKRPACRAEFEMGARLDTVAPAHAAEPLFWVLESWLAYAAGLRGSDHARYLVKRHIDKEDWRGATLDALRWLGAAAWDNRGKKGVFLDCPVSVAYWRYRLAQQAAAAKRGASAEWYHEQMHGNSGLWAAVAEALVANLCALTDPWWLAQAVEGCVSLQHDSGGRALSKTDYRERGLIPLAQSSLDYCAPLTADPDGGRLG